MEYAKAHTKLLYGIGFSIAVVSLLLIEFASHAVMKAYWIHWLVLVTVLVLSISPFGTIKLTTKATDKRQRHFVSWLAQLFLLQLTLIFVFIGIALVFSHWLPLTTQEPHSNIMYQTTETLLYHNGLFPWAIYALYAGQLAYISYIKHQDAYIHTTLFPLLKSNAKTVLGTVLNVQARAATFIVIAITFGFMTLLIASVTMPHTTPLLTGFCIKTMIIAFMIIVFGFTKPFKKINKQLLNPKIPLFISTITTLILFAFLILLMNTLFSHLGQLSLTPPRLITWLERKNSMTLWIIFSSAWWIGWTPLIAAHMAKYSRGYSIRTLMLSLLILPSVLALFIYLFPEIFNTLSQAPLITSLLSLLAFIYLLIVLTKKKVLPMLIQCYLPRDDFYKHRDPYFYFRKLFQIMLVTIYLYLPSGISIIVLVIFILTLCFTLQIPISMLASLAKLNKKNKG